MHHYGPYPENDSCYCTNIGGYFQRQYRKSFSHHYYCCFNDFLKISQPVTTLFVQYTSFIVNFIELSHQLFLKFCHSNSLILTDLKKRTEERFLQVSFSLILIRIHNFYTRFQYVVNTLC